MYLSRFIIKSLVSKVLDVNKGFTSIMYKSPLLSVYSPRIVFMFGKKTIAKQLGISEPPKRPRNPYILYFVDEIKNISNMKLTDKCKVLSQKWQSMSESAKVKYIEKYRVEAEIYEKKIKEYKQNLTPDQIKVMEDLEKRRKMQKEVSLAKRKLRTECEELGKPKYPGNQVTMYAVNYKNENPQKISLKDAVEKWRNLSEHEKNIYEQKSKKLLEKYQIDLYAWEIKMLKLNRTDLVRTSTLASIGAKKNQQKLKQSADVKDKEL